jgi:hypothetical protein
MALSAKEGIQITETVKEWKWLDSLPFESDNTFMTTFNTDNDNIRGYFSIVPLRQRCSREVTNPKDPS